MRYIGKLTFGICICIPSKAVQFCADLREHQPRPSQELRHQNPCQWRRKQGSSHHDSVQSSAPRISPLQCWQSGRDSIFPFHRWWCLSGWKKEQLRRRNKKREELLQSNKSIFFSFTFYILCIQNDVKWGPCWNWTHSDSFNHEADVADAHEICSLVDGVYGFHMAGDLQGKCLVQSAVE